MALLMPKKTTETPNVTVANKQPPNRARRGFWGLGSGEAGGIRGDLVRGLLAGPGRRVFKPRGDSVRRVLAHDETFMMRLATHFRPPIHKAMGMMLARNMDINKLTTPSTTNITVQLFNASASVNAPILAKIQKPLSFIHDPTNEPPPMDVAR